MDDNGEFENVFFQLFRCNWSSGRHFLCCLLQWRSSSGNCCCHHPAVIFLFDDYIFTFSQCFTISGSCNKPQPSKQTKDVPSPPCNASLLKRSDIKSSSSWFKNLKDPPLDFVPLQRATEVPRAASPWWRLTVRWETLIFSSGNSLEPNDTIYLYIATTFRKAKIATILSIRYPQNLEMVAGDEHSAPPRAHGRSSTRHGGEIPGSSIINDHWWLS